MFFEINKYLCRLKECVGMHFECLEIPSFFLSIIIKEMFMQKDETSMYGSVQKRV